MKATGIIVEYNPFHKGHQHHLHKARETGLVIAILSGRFSQRGLPSLLDPADKVRLALENGADIVLLLPSVYAANAAGHFAKYAVQSLAVLQTDGILFGSESNDPQRLAQLADLPPANDPSTSQARANTALPPNDLLGIEYIRQCRTYGMDWACIQRDDSFVSATATRNAFFAGEDVFLQDSLQPKQRWETYYPYLRFLLLMQPAEELARIHLVTEGIEHRLKKCALAHSDWNGFLESAISKTYSRARIQRTALMILLQVSASWFQEHADFDLALVAGATEAGKAWLKTHPDPRILVRQRDWPDWLKDIQSRTRFLYSLGETK